MPVKTDLALRLRTARETAGISQRALARLLGVSHPTILSWEAGRTEPRPTSLEALASALHTTPGALAGWTS